MKILTFAVSLLCMLYAAQSVTGQNLELDDLRCEYKTNPIGLDIMQPRLSWKIKSNDRAVLQTAYQIQVAATENDLQRGRRLLWDSGKMTTDQSNHVQYEGDPLKARQRVYWHVKIWDNKNRESEWSTPAYWELGLLEPTDWTANWIQSMIRESIEESEPVQLLRHTFTADRNIEKARLYVTSQGLYEAMINGEKIGDEELTPGWTSYNKRLQYQTYDVTDQVQEGENAIGVMLGDGWYRGWLAWQNRRNVYGDKLALLFQLEIEYANGDTETIVSDGNWKSSTGPILKSDIYNGEHYDARLEKEGWATTDYDDSEWLGVRQIEADKNRLIAPAGPPVKRIEELEPARIFTTPNGETVVDMGQNMVGWIRLTVNEEEGTQITLHHAEVLNKDGNFYTANLRAADQEIIYTCKGEGEEVYEPTFTFQGFRYVRVKGFTPTKENLTGIVVHSDMEPTGTFNSSNAMLNQLQHNIVWGQKGNFVDVPTDCPQRDERLGWTGDAQVFAPTAAYNMDVASFFTKWLADLEADQFDDGRVPHVIPHVLGQNSAGATGWADAATIIPWTIYRAYGDERILAEQYDSMKEWVEYIRSEAGDNYLWQTGFHFGDWLYYNSTNPGAEAAFTDKDFLATAFFAHSTDILRKSAELLGKTADAKEYSDLYQKIVTAFQNEFISPAGRVAPNTQTAYTLALKFDLVPENLRQEVANRLVRRIEYRDNHISTGFLGTPHIMFALSENGHWEAAYKLLLQDSYPSWLYPITMGATTIWERWDGIKPDSTFQDVGMNSFNHYAYGAVGDWMYKNIAGINPDVENPGYKHIIIRPQPGGDLDSAKGTLETMYGEIVSDWAIDGNSMTLQVQIPANATATIYLPDAMLEQVKENDQSIETAQGISSTEQVEDAVKVQVGSGEYTFTYPIQQKAAG